jgi:hypothetical protein
MEAAEQCMSRISATSHHRGGFVRAKKLQSLNGCEAKDKGVEQGAAVSAFAITSQ